MNLVLKFVQLQDVVLKFAASGEKKGPLATGYASTFNGLDSVGDRIQRGAYAKVLKQKQEVPAYVNHGWRTGALPIGRFVDLAEDDHGLKASLVPTPGMTAASDAMAALRDSTVSGLSVALVLHPNDTERLSDGTRLVKSVTDIFEISVATVPADARAQVTDVRSAPTSRRGFERSLRELGFDRGAAGLIAAKSWKHLQLIDDGEDVDTPVIQATPDPAQEQAVRAALADLQRAMR